jgi:hypothetical protein
MPLKQNGFFSEQNTVKSIQFQTNPKTGATEHGVRTVATITSFQPVADYSAARDAVTKSQELTRKLSAAQEEQLSLREAWSKVG